MKVSASLKNSKMSKVKKQKPEHIENIVFDEFYANETLCFLFSPLHLVKGLLRIQARTTESNSVAIDDVLSQPAKLELLQQSLLSRASGFHIPELTDEENISQALDDVYDSDERWMGDDIEQILGKRLESLNLTQVLMSQSNQAIKSRSFYETGSWAQNSCLKITLN